LESSAILPASTATASASAGVYRGSGTVVVVEGSDGKGSLLLVLALMLGASMLVVGYVVLEVLGALVRLVVG
jgi:hypothetical protein